MPVSVAFQDERFEFDIPSDRLVAHWQGPVGVPPSDARRLVAAALEAPSQFPPLRRSVVPGDHVVIALDPAVPETGAILDVVCGILRDGGVAAEEIVVLLTGGELVRPDFRGPEGVQIVVHEPEDKTHLAYLASTSQGRRIYLNRHLTDADLVVSVGRLGYDPALGYRGPWGVLYPGLSDEATRRAFRSRASEAVPEPDRPTAALSESAEVSWLLGSQFQIAVVPGAAGMAGVVAGLDSTVRVEGPAQLDRAWSFRAESRVELALVGIGGPETPAGLDELAAGLATATRLVRRGGKIVALSRASVPVGPSLRRLVDAADSRAVLGALRGQEAEEDYVAARRFAQALDWADVYLLSGLDPDLAEQLSIITLDRPEEARRLVALADSCVVVSHAELTRASTGDEDG